MRRFMIRDLMINLGPAQGEALAACPLNSFCPANSCGWTIILDPPCAGGTVACAVCTLRLTDGCPPVSDCGLTACHPAITNTGPLDFFSVENLDALKQELQRELGHVERVLAEREADMQPRTLADVDELEKKLADALDALRERREALKAEQA
jgi:hypothetical protein